MEQFPKLEKQIRIRLFFGILAVASIMLGLFYVGILLDMGDTVAAIMALLLGVLLSFFVTDMISNDVLGPIKTLQRAVLHVDPAHQGTPAPSLDSLRVGRELVTDTVLRIYQFASQQDSKDLIEHRRSIIQAANVVEHMPLPLFVINKELLVTSASKTALGYCEIDSAQLLGKPLFDGLHMEFRDEHTLDDWVADCQANKVTDTAYWERVHVLSRETNEVIRQCDIAAYYNKDNPSGTEFIITLFDRTDRYDEDDDSLSFVALAVHELRTPITMLRGYIEVFEEELEGKLDPELANYMLKLDTAAKRLSSFVTNILDVVRVDQNQLTLHLSEADWPTTIKATMVDMEQLASLQGIAIEYNVAPALPTVAVDSTAIAEVIVNIVENALKYSGQSKRIVINTGLNKEGLVETTIQDFGVGIPESVLPDLFEKFSRNHRTRDAVKGTGLGLYLCKAIVSAHNGQIWASSKADQGSTFGFTLHSYAAVSNELKDSTNKEITRHAHGWIKNHSLYKR